MSLPLNGEGEVYYAVNGNVLKKPNLWERRPIQLQIGRQYLLQAYAKDRAGNRSAIVSSNYILTEPEPGRHDPLLAILSPATGELANHQMLAILSVTSNGFAIPLMAETLFNMARTMNIRSLSLKRVKSTSR